MASQWAAVTVLVVALLVYLMVVLADAAQALAGKSEVRRLAEQGGKRAALVQRAHMHHGRWIATALLLRVGSLLLAGSALVYFATHMGISLAGEIVVSAIVWMVIGAAHLGLRLWAQREPLKTALRAAWIIEAALVLMTPFTLILRWFTNQVRSTTESEEDTILIANDGTRLLLPNDGESEPMEESEKEMITSILEMDETVVREVMVPRPDMVAIEASATLDEALDAIIGAGHSRIPIYEESIDQVLGVLYAKDILSFLREGRGSDPLASLLRPAYFVPLSKNVKTLLAEMRKHRVHIAIVADEYGGTAGLVTIEDILEEIVGEIQDEYDAVEELLIQRTGEASYIINARIDIYSLAKLLDIDIADEDADTAGGLVFGLLGHIAEVGDAVAVQGWRFTVLGVDGRRIDSLRADPIEPPSDEEEQPRAKATRTNGTSLKLSPTEE